jgi:hypothetical protein
MNNFSSLCDDFSVSMVLVSKLDMPNLRDPVVTFFESVRRQFPELTDFEKRDEGEFALEEDRDGGSYRSVALERRRLTAVAMNPTDSDSVDLLNETLLDMAPYHLGVSNLDADALDVQYAFDFLYTGNHDEIVTEALAAGGPLENLARAPGVRPLHFQPSMTLALDETFQLQGRLSVDTRSTAYQVRTGNYVETPITVLFTVRQFWGKPALTNFVESYRRQRTRIDELVAEHVVPHVVEPIARAIAAK